MTMHCALRNISGKALEVDASTLPWNNADLFSAIAVAADGKVVAQNKDPPPFFGSRIGAPAGPAAIPSGESMEGRFDLKYMHVTNLPRNEDLLLPWSYRHLKNWSSGDQYVSSGITLLNAKSQTPATVSTKNSPNSSVSGTSVSVKPTKLGVADNPDRNGPSVQDLRGAREASLSDIRS